MAFSARQSGGLSGLPGDPLNLVLDFLELEALCSLKRVNSSHIYRLARARLAEMGARLAHEGVGLFANYLTESHILLGAEQKLARSWGPRASEVIAVCAGARAEFVAARLAGCSDPVGAWAPKNLGKFLYAASVTAPSRLVGASPEWVARALEWCAHNGPDRGRAFSTLLKRDDLALEELAAMAAEKRHLHRGAGGYIIAAAAATTMVTPFAPPSHAPFGAADGPPLHTVQALMTAVLSLEPVAAAAAGPECFGVETLCAMSAARQSFQRQSSRSPQDRAAHSLWDTFDKLRQSVNKLRPENLSEADRGLVWLVGLDHAARRSAAALLDGWRCPCLRGGPPGVSPAD